MGDGAPTDASGRGPLVPGGGRSSHAPQDAATGASSPFTWQGGPLIGPLVALLAAAGAPPGMGVGAWPGFPSTGAPPGLGAGTWPFFPAAGVPPDQPGRRLHGWRHSLGRPGRRCRAPSASLVPFVVSRKI
jgi:hypothetical protein